ncbi:MAG: hypothetical protein ABIN89_26400 [Chitinophagaceae bacterium]
MPYLSCIYEAPYLYRYEDNVYIDLFFETGKILISAFQVYRSYDDNQLGDFDEGKSKFVHNSVDEEIIKSNATGHMESGKKSYCFCTSTILDKKLFNTFKRNWVFRIKDVGNFGMEISKKIEGTTNEMFFGNCIYLNERVLREKVGTIALRFQPTDTDIKSFEIFSGSLFGSKLLFVKLIKYQSQSEYRMLWPNLTNVNCSLVLDCPGAIKYCEKISTEEVEEVFRHLSIS